MQPGGHRATTQARQLVSVSSPSPFLSPAVPLFGADCPPSRPGLAEAGLRADPHPSRFVNLSLSPLFSTPCALLLRSFALSTSSTALLSYDYERFDRTTRGGGTAPQPLLCFHNLTKPFSRNTFILTTLQNPRECP